MRAALAMQQHARRAGRPSSGRERAHADRRQHRRGAGRRAAGRRRLHRHGRRREHRQPAADRGPAGPGRRRPRHPRRHRRGRSATRRSGCVVARGREEPVEAWAAHRGASPRRAAAPAGPRSPLVGRDAEVGLLCSAMTTASPTGGRTSLCSSARPAWARAGWPRRSPSTPGGEHCACVFEGRSLPYGEANVWWPLAEALRQAFGIALADDAGQARAPAPERRTWLERGTDDRTSAARRRGAALPLGPGEPADRRRPVTGPRRGGPAGGARLPRSAGRAAPSCSCSPTCSGPTRSCSSSSTGCSSGVDRLPLVVLLTARPELDRPVAAHGRRRQPRRAHPRPARRRGRPTSCCVAVSVASPTPSWRAACRAHRRQPVLPRGAGRRCSSECGTLPALSAGRSRPRCGAWSRPGSTPCRPPSGPSSTTLPSLGRRGPVAALVALGRRALGAAGSAPGTARAGRARPASWSTANRSASGPTSCARSPTARLPKAERARRHAALGVVARGRVRRGGARRRGPRGAGPPLGHRAELAAELGGVDGVPDDVRERALAALERAADRAEDREIHASCRPASTTGVELLAHRAGRAPPAPRPSVGPGPGQDCASSTRRPPPTSRPRGRGRAGRRRGRPRPRPRGAGRHRAATPATSPVHRHAAAGPGALAGRSATAAARRRRCAASAGRSSSPATSTAPRRRPHEALAAFPELGVPAGRGVGAAEPGVDRLHAGRERRRRRSARRVGRPLRRHRRLGRLGWASGLLGVVWSTRGAASRPRSSPSAWWPRPGRRADWGEREHDLLLGLIRLRQGRSTSAAELLATADDSFRASEDLWGRARTLLALCHTLPGHRSDRRGPRGRRPGRRAGRRGPGVGRRPRPGPPRPGRARRRPRRSRTRPRATGRCAPPRRAASPGPGSGSRPGRPERGGDRAAGGGAGRAAGGARHVGAGPGRGGSEGRGPGGGRSPEGSGRGALRRLMTGRRRRGVVEVADGEPAAARAALRHAERLGDGLDDRLSARCRPGRSVLLGDEGTGDASPRGEPAPGGRCCRPRAAPANQPPSLSVAFKVGAGPVEGVGWRGVGHEGSSRSSSRS